MSIEQAPADGRNRPRFEILSPAGIGRIHDATLDVIERIGVRFPSTRAQAIWAEHGATVDRETGIVKAPAALIEKAMSTAPAAYTLGARDATLDLPLDGEHVYLGTDGCGIEVLDPWTLEVRRSALSDVGDIARVADALPEIAFHWVAVSAQDVPPEARSLEEVTAVWRNSTKHVQTESIVTAEEARVAIDMAAAIAGGSDALRAHPVLSLMQCTISPLAHDGGAIDAGLEAAAAGVPVGYMTMASCAFSGPATVAGSLVVGNAEVIAALALMQLAHPGSPVYYAAAQTAMDLRSGAYTGGGPEDFLFGAVTNQLADFYKVPLSMGAYATGAKRSDWQAGLENGLSAFMASVTGSDMLLGAGLLHGSRIWSYEQMILDCEIATIVQKMLGGITVDDASLALEAIEEVGPGGTFLTSPHTRSAMKGLWQPKYLDRRPYGAWQADPDKYHREALERARTLLRDHRPEPMEPVLDAELTRMIAAHTGAAAGA
ncbi:MAG TPA: trimethylamine methyltransferase family protein [Candidatus Limnocylindrales bacterium]|nr:trimethylamine methyltransferase family protein [Candidatus Limnocylindrales bacterium]